MKNILIPTDLTDCTNNTINYAINLAIKSNAKLFFYHTSEKNEFINKESFTEFIVKTFPEICMSSNQFAPFMIKNICVIMFKNTLI
jgi:hypothetical protein